MTQQQEGNGFPPAVYLDQPVPHYVGNRFIEALPPILDDNDEIKRIQRLVTVNEKERAYPAHVRYHMIYAIPGSFMQPLTDHVLLAKEVAAMIRVGYLTRNPSSPMFLRKLGLVINSLSGPSIARSSVSGQGIALIGMSGVGKSTAMDEVLKGYPQVIWHPELTGPLRTTFQLPWIKVSCPTDGSIKAICRSFFTEVDFLLGTNYHHLHARNGTLESMRDAMATVAFVHGVGLLVIDEVQNLRAAKGTNANSMLSFFLVLRDVLKVPVIAIGTEAARPILGGDFKVARRHAGAPLFDRMERGPIFTLFCRSLFGAYYLREPLNPTPEFISVLYDLSQGIADIVIKLFVLAQMRALNLECEHVDASLVQFVYADCLGLLHEHLDDIRNGRQVDEVGYEMALRRSTIDNVNVVAPAAPQVAHPLASSLDLGRRTPSSIAGSARNASISSKKTTRRDTSPRAIEPLKLVDAVNERSDSIAAYDALKESGHIRGLGAEVVAGA